VVKMDVSRKLYKEDIIFLNELQTELLRKDKKITQKDLIDKTIRFVKEHKKNFIDYLTKGHTKNNTREMTERFLSLPKADLGRNWLEEIDTIEHDDLLRRLKKDDKEGYL